MFCENLRNFKVSYITSLFFNRFSSGFHCYVWKFLLFLLKFKLYLFRISPLKGLYLLQRRFKKWRSKWVKRSCGLYVYGRLTEFEPKNPPWDFHGLKNTHLFTCKPTTKSIESCVYFTEFFGFRFLTRVPMGNYLPVWALYLCTKLSKYDTLKFQSIIILFYWRCKSRWK